MLGTFLDKLNNLFDRRFVITYWSPIFIGLGLMVGLIGSLIGFSTALGWWTQRNVTEQVLLGVSVLLVITVLAYLLETLTIPLIRLYEGYWPKGWLTGWAWTLQETRKKKSSESIRYHNFPRDSKRMKPTRLGNMLASAEEYPHQLYQLDAVLWWPRLVTLLPEVFRTQVDTALTPMLAMLNLSMIFILLAVGGGIAVIVIHWLWWVFLVTILGGFLLAWGCYRAAISQAGDYCVLVQVAFDLYRYDILKQMHIPLPDNLYEERLLWDVLNKWLYFYQPPREIPTVSDAPRPTDPFYNDNHQPPAATSQSQEIILTMRDETVQHE
jgi:hypothetical protein